MMLDLHSHEKKMSGMAGKPDMTKIKIFQTLTHSLKVFVD